VLEPAGGTFHHQQGVLVSVSTQVGVELLVLVGALVGRVRVCLFVVGVGDVCLFYISYGFDGTDSF